jgi:autotransporter translocation and assembly factor TamB
MRAAVSGKLRFRTSQDMAFDVRLAARGFSPQTLNALGMDSSSLRASIDADAHASAADQRIAYRVQVRAPDSDAELSGELNAQHVLWAHLVSERLALAQITNLTTEPLAFEIDASLDLSSPDKLEAQVNLVRGNYGELALPECSMKGARSNDGTIRLHTLEARYADAVLSATGVLQPDGVLQADAKLDVPQLAAVPAVQAAVQGLGGALSAQLRLRRAASATIDASADLDLRRFELQGNRAQHVSLRAHASGWERQPALSAQLVASDLFVAGEHVAQADVEIGGGPERYRVSARVDERRLVLDGWAEAKPNCWDGGLTLTSDIGQAPLSLSLPLLRFVPGNKVEVHELRLSYLDAALFVDGLVGLGEHDSRLRLGATIPNLALLTSKFGASEVPGRVELAGSVRGPIGRPAFDVRVDYSDGFKLGKQPGQADLRAVADFKRGAARIDLSAKAGSAHVRARLDSRWKRNAPPAAALETAEHDLEASVNGISIGALLQPSDPDLRARVDGIVSGHLNVHGNQHKFRLETQFAARVRALRDPASVDLIFTGTYADAKLRTELKAGDRRGQLLSFKIADEIDAERLIAHPGNALDIVTKTRWEASAEFAERRLRELPVVSGLGVDSQLEPLMVASIAHIAHEPNAEPVGELQTTLRWEPGQVAEPEYATCSERARGTLTLSGQLADGKLAVLLKGGPGSADAITLETGLRAKLAELLAGKYSGLGPLKLNVLVDQLDLARLPIVCERGAGVVSASLAGTDMFNQLAAIKLKAQAHALQWDLSPALEVTADGHAEGDELVVGALLQSGRGALRVDGRLPIGFRVGDPALCVNRAAAVGIRTRFEHVEVASLLAYVPGVARESGTVDGTIDVSGTLQQPSAKGALQLDDVSFTLPRLGQRFSHLYVKASVDGRSLRLQNGKVRDLDGSASLAARLTLNSAKDWTAEVNMNARNFPLRKTGVIMGHADADARIVARTTPQETSVSVELKNVAVQLTSDDFGAVQSLDPHPEIIFSDAVPEPEPEAEKQSATQPSVPAKIHIVTTEPLWVRRDDFAVQMLAELNIVLGGETPELTGKIELRRGFISLLGQSFDIKRGQVLLTGGGNIDPQLEITATHSTPGGTVVRLEVTGFVHAPQLAFFVNDQAVTAGEAVTAMTGRNDPGSNSSSSAEQEIASAAMGMTTGLLSLGARREFGDWIPMLSIEQGDQTRVRVGVEADRLIPKFLRGFVRGAYVEGIVATGDNNSGQAGQSSANTSATANTAAGGGVLLELLLPSDFVWAGQYGPGESWSVDVDWRP